MFYERVNDCNKDSSNNSWENSEERPYMISLYVLQQPWIIKFTRFTSRRWKLAKNIVKRAIRFLNKCVSIKYIYYGIVNDQSNNQIHLFAFYQKSISNDNQAFLMTVSFVCRVISYFTPWHVSLRISLYLSTAFQLG